MKKTTWAWLALILAAGVYLFGPWNDEERQLRRRLAEIKDLVVKEGPESDLDAANKARQLGHLFTRGFEIRLLPFDQVVTDRQRMMQVMLGYRRGSERVGVGFRDLEIELQAGGSAQMSVVAVVSGWTEGQVSREGYRFQLLWIREDSEWRIREAELVEVLDGGLLF